MFVFPGEAMEITIICNQEYRKVHPWTKDGKRLREDKIITKQDKEKFSLTLSNISVADAGKYSTAVENFTRKRERIICEVFVIQESPRGKLIFC